MEQGLPNIQGSEDAEAVGSGTEGPTFDDDDDDEDFVDEIEEIDICTTLPDNVILKFLGFISVEDVKRCRLVSRRFNSVTLYPSVIQANSCFIFDGRHDDSTGTKCQAYFRDSRHGCKYWDTLRVRRGYYRQLTWLTAVNTATITTLQLNNCSISWSNILQILSSFDNLVTFSDVQDMYCWDYATFSEGLEVEKLPDNPHFQRVNQERLGLLGKLKRVEVHRSQITDCTTYLKMLLLRCIALEHLSITTDQGLNPRPTSTFFKSLGDLLQRNCDTLQTLWFPYKSVYPVYELRVSDDHHPFREFTSFITENRWGEEIQPKVLTDLSIQFPVIHIEESFFRDKLLPFLQSWTSLRNLFLNCIFIEPGREHFILESIPNRLNLKLGVWWGDSAGRVPQIQDIQRFFHTITIQSWRPAQEKQIKEFLPLFDPEDENATLDPSMFEYQNTKEFQFFNKSTNFRFFNMDLLINTFPNLSHLNLVDHNTRVDRVHSSEAPATIEDEDIQLLIRTLRQLNFLQLIGNMSYITDSGMTGISLAACKRMVKKNSFILRPQDVTGVPFAHLKQLKVLILRGVGIKITDVTAHFAFFDMPHLSKMHIYGCQQISPEARTALSRKGFSSKGCDIQI